MRLIVLGATGGIGKYLLEYATARGHEVTAFVRSPQKIVLKSEKLRVLPGDLLDADQLAQVLRGHDAVLSAFGPSTLRRVTTRGAFGKALATAMQRSGVRRGLVVSSALLFAEQNAIGKLLRGTLFRNLIPDMTAMEAAIERDGLEWTIVRPPRLTNSALTPSYHVSDGRLPKGMTVSRACVADFMVKEAERPAHVRQIVGLSK
ncbi:MAG TPA: NAD(P)H-binding protein [Acidobacteriaceae bacterium]|jgi:putative NADH-flavin reductase|nr:NAD(P)H-binding protein [Acidobacteriaceae bacterium]